jgi:two-component system LytT family response regulator
VRLVVIDDEPAARRAIARLVERHPAAELVGEAGSIASGVAVVEATRPDAIVLDVVMPGATGFQLLRMLTFRPRVVVYSGHAERAVDAFAEEAFDFLLKPVDYPRFAKVMRRLDKSIALEAGLRRQRAVGDDAGPIRITDRRGQHLLDTAEIVAVTADKECCRVLLGSGRSLLANETIGRLETRLPAPTFRRVGRSLIVNMAALERIEPRPQGKGVLRFRLSEVPLAVGRAVMSSLRGSA